MHEFEKNNWSAVARALFCRDQHQHSYCTYFASQIKRSDIVRRRKKISFIQFNLFHNSLLPFVAFLIIDGTRLRPMTISWFPSGKLSLSCGSILSKNGIVINFCNITEDYLLEYYLFCCLPYVQGMAIKPLSIPTDSAIGIATNTSFLIKSIFFISWSKDILFWQFNVHVCLNNVFHTWLKGNSQTINKSLPFKRNNKN